MSRAQNYFAWQSRLVLPEVGCRVLEIGCGTGNFTRYLLDREAVIAIDSEPVFIEHLRARYPGRTNLHPLVHDASAGLSDLKHYRADSCVCLNVLEHIEDDAGALRAMANAITPGGPVVLIVPAFPALAGPIDRNLGHFRRYTKASLSRVAERSGLRVRRIHYMNLPGFFGWWLNAKILGRTSQSAQQVAFFDRAIVPVAAAGEAIVKPPFGQSVFCVLVQ